MESHYEINVSRMGRHYFATHARSLTGSKQKALEMLAEIRTRFPAHEGFEATLSYIECFSHKLPE